MYEKIVINIFNQLYPIIRPLLVQAIDDPETEWDDVLVGVCDHIFMQKVKRKG